MTHDDKRTKSEAEGGLSLTSQSRLEEMEKTLTEVGAQIVEVRQKGDLLRDRLRVIEVPIRAALDVDPRGNEALILESLLALGAVVRETLDLIAEPQKRCGCGDMFTPGADGATKEECGNCQAVHFLRDGRALCGFYRKEPCVWSPGHLWASSPSRVTCRSCLKAL